MHQVVGGSHVLAKLLLQTKQAERGGRVRVALRERTTAGQATAGGGGSHRWRDQGRVWTERGGDTFNYFTQQMRDTMNQVCEGQRKEFSSEVKI